MITFRSILKQRYLTFYSAIAVVIIMPIYVHYLPPVMIFWGLSWLAENRLSFSRKMCEENKAGVLLSLFIILYIWQICGLLYTDSVGSGFERIFKRLSFLFFPLVLFYPGERILNNIKLIVRIFAIATFAYLIYCLGNALYESINFTGGVLKFTPHSTIYEYENYFYSERLTAPAHPSYIAIYVVISLVVSMDAIFEKAISIFRRLSWIFITMILLISLYLLSSKAGILAGGVAIIGFMAVRIYNKIPKLITLLLVLGLTASFYFVGRHNTRVNYFIEEISDKNVESVFKSDIRYSIWKSAFSVIKEHPLFGVGTGDASDKLKKEFISKGYVDGYYDNLNAHNQFLEILLENGIIGILIFFGLLGYMFYLSLSTHNYIYGLFILVILIFFSFETILNRLAGITFFPLFTFLLYYYMERNNNI